jgi:ATP-binding cassette subfamily C (CFTR/MRP) protein 10
LISSGLVVVAVTAGLLRALLFAQGGLRAARALYERLALAVFHTDMRFFEVTAIGRLTNRFGKDSNTIDDSLPFIMNILLAQTFLLLGSCVVIAVSDPPILLLFIIVAVIYHRMQKFYRKSSRELRRLDSVHKSPVYTVFLECVASAPILRGFGEHCVLHFDALLQGHLDKALRVALSVEVSSQWLGECLF